MSHFRLTEHCRELNSRLFSTERVSCQQVKIISSIDFMHENYKKKTKNSVSPYEGDNIIYRFDWAWKLLVPRFLFKTDVFESN